MASSEIIQALSQCDIFSTVDEADIEKMASLCEVISLDAGSTVFSQGEYSSKIYLIAEGQVALMRSVTLGGRDGSMTIDVLAKGRGLGWSSLVCDPSAVSATAVCQKPTRLVCLSGHDLRSVLESDPELGFKVMDRLAQVIGNRLRAVYGAIDTFK